MGPRRRRWRRGVARGALLALGLALLGLVASGRGEELLAEALAAWGEWGGNEGPEMEGGGPAVAIGGPGGGIGGPGGGIRSPGVINGGPGVINGGLGAVIGGPGVAIGSQGGGISGPGAIIGGPGLINGGPGVINGGLGIAISGPGGVISGPGAIIGSPGLGIGGPGVSISGPGSIVGGPAAPVSGPGSIVSGPGSIVSGPAAAVSGPGSTVGGPAAPPGCLALLSGGSGELDAPRVLLSPPPCSPPAPFLLVLVPSATSHLARRQAVRDTWGGRWGQPWGQPERSRTVFVVGKPPSRESQRELLRESLRHRDVLQGDFGDTYANLTLKTFLLLRWATACCAAAPFLVKADDDVFLNVPAIATYLSRPATPPRLYLGRVHWRVSPNRDPRSRHHVPPELYPQRAFPPYCSGTAYVLSRRAAAAVLRAAAAVARVAPEDVWVGLCARRAGVAARHSARFGGSLRFPAERCCLGAALFSAHGVRPREMRAVWAAMAARGRCGALQGALGLLGCRALAWGEWLWGGAE